MRQVGELSQLILDLEAGRRIGYVTDLRYSDENVHALSQLMQGSRRAVHRKRVSGPGQRSRFAQKPFDRGPGRPDRPLHGCSRSNAFSFLATL
ncbi:hypothetical protein ACTMU2_40785 [Cupriavidus basilensis]